MYTNYDTDGFPIDDFVPATDKGAQIHRVHTWQGSKGVALCGVEVLHLTTQEYKKGERRCKECTKTLRKLRSAHAMAKTGLNDSNPALTPYSKTGFRVGLRYIKTHMGARHTKGGSSHNRF